MKVNSLGIRKIFTTNSKQTIEVVLQTSKVKVSASVPIGTSRGKYEVNYLPADDAIQKFNLVRRYFSNQDFIDQQEVDKMLHTIDTSVDFRNIGGNVALAISSAFLKAFSAEDGKEVFQFLSKGNITSFPKPLCNVVGGWKKQSDVQEYLLLPVHQKSFFDSMEKISKSYLRIGDELKKSDENFNYGKNIESAWVSGLGVEDILEIITAVGHENLLRLGMDFAASQTWDGNNYHYSEKRLRSHDQITFIEDIARRFPITYIEDPFHQDDFDSFSILMHHLQGKIICGDDLTSTNLDRLNLGISHNSVNAIIVKPSQIGTITDTTKVVEYAKSKGIRTVVSHRSGETEDVLISHLAVGLGTDYIKLGISGERTTKINEMLRIEELIGK